MSMGPVLDIEFDELGGCARIFSMMGFVKWLIDVGEVSGLSARELQSLHLEYCMCEGMRPLTPAKQAQAWAKVGIRKRRPRANSKAKPGGRPMVYHIDPKLVAAHRARTGAGMKVAA